MGKKLLVHKKSTFETVDIDDLTVGMYNARQSSTNIDELANSIRYNGLIHPLTVLSRNEDSGTYEVIAGQGRLNALLSIKENAEDEEFENLLKNVPVRVYLEELTEAEIKSISAAENMHRQDMTNAEIITIVQDLYGRTGSEEVVAEMLGKSLRATREWIGAAQWPDKLRQLLTDGEYSRDQINRCITTVEATTGKRVKKSSSDQLVDKVIEVLESDFPKFTRSEQLETIKVLGDLPPDENSSPVEKINMIRKSQQNTISISFSQGEIDALQDKSEESDSSTNDVGYEYILSGLKGDGYLSDD